MELCHCPHGVLAKALAFLFPAALYTLWIGGLGTAWLVRASRSCGASGAVPPSGPGLLLVNVWSKIYRTKTRQKHKSLGSYATSLFSEERELWQPTPELALLSPTWNLENHQYQTSFVITHIQGII